MMRLLLQKLVVISLLTMAAGVQAATQTELDPGLVNPGYQDKPDWFKISFLDLYEDIDDATAEDRRVMLYFYQDGCPYCTKLLQDNFAQKHIADKTREHFDVVAINIWGDKEVTIGDRVITEKQFAEALKVQYTPTLLFFDEKRKSVFRANGYYAPETFVALLDYVGEGKEQQLSYQAYLQQVDPQPASGRLHTEVTSVADSSDLHSALRDGRHLLVMFGQRQCATCDELHLDILKRPESKEQLARLDVVVLDMWSDETIRRPDGKTGKLSDWARELDIKYAPSMVYFNDQGEEVFRAEAYLRAFHTQSIMDYVASGAYKSQSNFQRYIDARADELRARGVEVNLMD